ncbi:MAG: ParB/RepB/Spo0J family partition protein [Bdellovibrionales bacterium]|nr:ParB/RepB/Spo0J family partition protein [Bdellovibrionales bacterium]
MARRKLTLANNPLLSGPALLQREQVSGVPYREVNISSIERDSNQPRVNFDEEKLKELSESIKTYGVISPILVRASKLPGKYQLIAGERRLRASKLAGLSTVPVILDNEQDETGEVTLAKQLVENLQRADLTPLERSHAIGALKEAYGLSIRQVADKLGVSKGMVQRSLDILNLPADLLNALREGASESKVLLLAKIEDEASRLELLKELEGLTRKQLESRIEEGSPKKKAKKRKPGIPAEDRRISEEIQRAIGLKTALVRSQKDKQHGKLTIDFYSDDDLQLIFRKLVAE